MRLTSLRTKSWIRPMTNKGQHQIRIHWMEATYSLPDHPICWGLRPKWLRDTCHSRNSLCWFEVITISPQQIGKCGSFCGYGFPKRHRHSTIILYALFFVKFLFIIRKAFFTIVVLSFLGAFWMPSVDSAQPGCSPSKMRCLVLSSKCHRSTGAKKDTTGYHRIPQTFNSLGIGPNSGNQKVFFHRHLVSFVASLKRVFTFKPPALHLFITSHGRDRSRSQHLERNQSSRVSWNIS